MKLTPLQAGAAKIDITPAGHCDLTGFIAREVASLGAHDPLFARALALRSGSTQALVISCDLLGLEAPFVAQMRSAIENAIGVPAQHIMLACTHTHAGAASMFLRHCGDVNASYMAQLAQQLTYVAREAWSTLRPAAVSSGKTRIAGVSINRRETNGPLDEDLDVVRFDDEGGRPLAALVGFGCHPIASGGYNRMLSADFPGVLTQEIEMATGATTLFLNGAAAQINPYAEGASINFNIGNFEMVQSLGASLAGAALEQWPQLKRGRRSTLRVQTHNLLLPLKLVDGKSIEPFLNEQAQTLARTASARPGETARSQYKVAAAMLEWAWKTRDALENRRIQKSIHAEVQMLHIGDVILIAVPGELFVEFGLKIKQVLAPLHAIVVGYANGNFGYLPTRAAYTQGGYEVDDAYKYYGYPAPLAPAAGEKIVRAVTASQRRGK
jgi:hypothetical protein